MLAGMLEGEGELTSSNIRFKNAMTMAVDYPGILKPTSPEAADMQPGHLQCVYVLLQARCGLTSEQHGRVLSALEKVSAAEPDDDIICTANQVSMASAQ